MNFVEKPTRRQFNADLAAGMRVAPAQLADGTRGVAVLYGDRPMVLTAEEALRLADTLADATETHEVD